MENVLARYALGEIRRIERIPTGLIHETSKIEAKLGDFILQKVSKIFGREMIADVDAVSQYLVAHGRVAQTVVKTRDGALWVEHDDEVWRLLTYIPGEVYVTIPNSDIAYEAGRILGQFHRDLEHFNYQFKNIRPMHQNVREHLRLFTEITHESTDHEIEPLRTLIVRELPKLFLPDGLRKNVTHGDPKITNIIFDQSNAMALVDVDDCGNQHNVLIELGDAFRSWCGAREDALENQFSIEIFEASLTGYGDGSRNFLNAEEVSLLPQAIKLIMLTLTSRFLRDYVEDSYFGWDATRYASRKAHNLARARGVAALYQDFCVKESAIREIIAKVV